MNTPLFSCPMCGYEFDNPAPGACQACPLHHGCTLVCCPRCGYQLVDPRQSQLATLLSRFSDGLGAQLKKRISPPPETHSPYNK